MPAPEPAPAPKKRKRVGDGPPRERAGAAKAEAPPPDESTRDKSWRHKYDGGVGGRERACIVLAKSVHATSYKVSRYIKDNGGVPFIDPDNQQEGLDWYNTLVCAWDEVLPAHVNAAPHLIAAITIGTLTAQSAATAYRVSKAKKASGETVKNAASTDDAIRAEAQEVKAKEEAAKRRDESKPTSEPGGELARMRGKKSGE